MVEAVRQRWGRVDILHYNVGVGITGGDAPLDEITEAAFDRIATINLRGAIMACKHVLPVTREQRAGVIITISSVAAWEQYPNVAYKATKAGMIAFTQQVAIQNAEFGIRANVILPGLMDTPMAVDTRARVSGKGRAEIAAARDARVPLRRNWARLGTSQTPLCFWRLTRRISLLALRCQSMAAPFSTSIEPLPRPPLAGHEPHVVGAAPAPSRKLQVGGIDEEYFRRATFTALEGRPRQPDITLM